MGMNNLKSIVRDGIGSISRRTFDSWLLGGVKETRSQPCSSAVVGDGVGGREVGEEEGSGSWRWLPPELLRDVVARVEESEAVWPARQNVVACASVCRSWRHMCKEIVAPPESTGKITFPISLKQPGPRSGPIQCYIKRNKSTSTYQLFLGLNSENGKFLMAARKVRRPTHVEYIISMSADDISRNGTGYMGKLRSNFLGTKFAIHDSQPPHGGAVTSSGRSSRRFNSRKVSPKVPLGNYGIAQIAYELNMLGSRGPRRMRCIMNSIPASSLEPNGAVPSYPNPPSHSSEDSFSSVARSTSMDRVLGDLKSSDSSRFTGSTRFTEVSVDVMGRDGPLILKNKPPRWHEQLQCWCLNFRGRVTIASVKNFQLVAASLDSAESNGSANTGTHTSQTGSSSDPNKIIVQFGKIGKDLFTMDYRYPLSAFQAFGICLSSFDSKLACE